MPDAAPARAEGLRRFEIPGAAFEAMAAGARRFAREVLWRGAASASRRS